MKKICGDYEIRHDNAQVRHKVWGYFRKKHVVKVQNRWQHVGWIYLMRVVLCRIFRDHPDVSGWKPWPKEVLAWNGQFDIQFVPLAVSGNFPQFLLSVLLPNSVVFCKTISSTSNNCQQGCEDMLFNQPLNGAGMFFQGFYLSASG